MSSPARLGGPLPPFRDPPQRDARDPPPFSFLCKLFYPFLSIGIEPHLHIGEFICIRVPSGATPSRNLDLFLNNSSIPNYIAGVCSLNRHSRYGPGSHIRDPHLCHLSSVFSPFFRSLSSRIRRPGQSGPGLVLRSQGFPFFHLVPMFSFSSQYS